MIRIYPNSKVLPLSETDAEPVIEHLNENRVEIEKEEKLENNDPDDKFEIKPDELEINNLEIKKSRCNRYLPNPKNV
jgi:hypothetical protein